MNRVLKIEKIMACAIFGVTILSCTSPFPQEQMNGYIREHSNLINLSEQAKNKDWKIVLEAQSKCEDLIQNLDAEKKVFFENDEQLQQKIKEKKAAFDSLRVKYLDLNDSISLQIKVNENFITNLKEKKIRPKAAAKIWSTYEHKIRDYEVKSKKMAWQLEDAAKDVLMLYQVGATKYGRNTKNSGTEK